MHNNRFRNYLDNSAFLLSLAKYHDIIIKQNILFNILWSNNIWLKLPKLNRHLHDLQKNLHPTRFKVEFEETKSRLSLFLLHRKQPKCPKSPISSHFLGIVSYTYFLSIVWSNSKSSLYNGYNLTPLKRFAEKCDTNDESICSEKVTPWND